MQCVILQICREDSQLILFIAVFIYLLIKLQPYLLIYLFIYQLSNSAIIMAW